MDQHTEAPPVVVDHFAATGPFHVHEFFVPGEGWVPSPAHPLTATTARGLARRGATRIAVHHIGRVADFDVKELTR